MSREMKSLGTGNGNMGILAKIRGCQKTLQRGQSKYIYRCEDSVHCRHCCWKTVTPVHDQELFCCGLESHFIEHLCFTWRSIFIRWSTDGSLCEERWHDRWGIRRHSQIPNATLWPPSSQVLLRWVDPWTVLWHPLLAVCHPARQSITLT